MTPDAFLHYRTGNASADEARWQIIEKAYETVENVADVELVRVELKQLLAQVQAQFRDEESKFVGQSYAPWHIEDHKRLESALTSMSKKMHESLPQNYKYNIRDWVRLLADHIETYDFQAEKKSR